ncbi:MAG: hypothetical protein ACRED0_07135 [Gammaproteobacteria bacterium]
MTRASQTPVRKRVGRPLVIGVAVALGVCAGCTTQPSDEVTYTAKPQPPYSSDRYSSTRLILERKESGFEVVSSSPSFGGVTQPTVAEALPEILEGKQRLYEYTVRDRDGALVAQGYFIVPLTARATFTEADDEEKIHHVDLDDPSSIVRVAIPFVADSATVGFRTMVPDQNRRYEDWAKESAGSITIEPSSVEPRQREESP